MHLHRVLLRHRVEWGCIAHAAACLVSRTGALLNVIFIWAVLYYLGVLVGVAQAATIASPHRICIGDNPSECYRVGSSQNDSCRLAAVDRLRLRCEEIHFPWRQRRDLVRWPTIKSLTDLLDGLDIQTPGYPYVEGRSASEIAIFHASKDSGQIAIGAWIIPKRKCERGLWYPNYGPYGVDCHSFSGIGLSASLSHGGFRGLDGFPYCIRLASEGHIADYDTSKSEGRNYEGSNFNSDLPLPVRLFLGAVLLLAGVATMERGVECSVSRIIAGWGITGAGFAVILIPFVFPI
jgi:hypothetical protein